MALAGIDHEGALYIDGDWVSPSGEATEDVVNPATEEVIASLPVGELAECDAALAAARTIKQRFVRSCIQFLSGCLGTYT